MVGAAWLLGPAAIKAQQQQRKVPFRVHEPVLSCPVPCPALPLASSGRWTACSTWLPQRRAAASTRWPKPCWATQRSTLTPASRTPRHPPQAPPSPRATTQVCGRLGPCLGSAGCNPLVRSSCMWPELTCRPVHCWCSTGGDENADANYSVSRSSRRLLQAVRMRSVLPFAPAMRLSASYGWCASSIVCCDLPPPQEQPATCTDSGGGSGRRAQFIEERTHSRREVGWLAPAKEMEVLPGRWVHTSSGVGGLDGSEGGRHSRYAPARRGGSSVSDLLSSVIRYPAGKK